MLLLCVVWRLGSDPSRLDAWGLTPAPVGGRVLDARTGAPVAKALVTIDSLHLTATTAPDGTFALGTAPPGTYQLTVSVVGYALARRDIQVPPSGVAVTIELTEGTTGYAETVTVTAGPFRVPADIAPGGQMLGATDLRNLGGVLADDPLRAVQALPGVATGDDFRSEFTVRGSDFDHLTFTIDGFDTPYVLHTVHVQDRGPAGSIAMIDSDVLEDVTLLNGGYAQHYSGHTGAEVDFRMREGARDRRRVSVSASGADASGVAEGPLGSAGRGSWLVSARQSYLDFLAHRLTSETLSFGFSDAQAKLAYDVTPHQHVTVSLIAGRSRFENDPERNTPNDLAVGLNRSAVAVGAWRWTGVRSTFTQRVLVAANRYRNDNPQAVNLDRGGARQLGYRADATVAVSHVLLAEAGAALGRDAADSVRIEPFIGRPVVIDRYDGAARSASGYADVKWMPRGRIVLSPGVRVAHTTLASQSAATPWFQAEVPAAGGQLRASAGVYTQFADLNEVFSFGGAPRLTPERAYQYDLGYERRIGTSARATVTVYNRENRDAVRRAGYETRVVGAEVIGGRFTAPYQNRMSGTSRGIEFVLQRQATSGASGWISYAYSRTRDTDTLTGETFWADADQRHTFNAYAAYRRSQRVSLAATLRIGSNFPIPGYIGYANGEYFVTDVRNTARFPVYARLDLRANRTFSITTHRLTLFAEVLNVLDRANVRYLPPRIDFVTRQASRPFDVLLPIVPSAGVTIEF